MDGGGEVQVKIDFYDLSGKLLMLTHTLLVINSPLSTPGDSNYKDVRNEFYNDVGGLILVYDVIDKSSFEALSNWMNEAIQYGVVSSNTTFVVIGNKIDQYPRVVAEHQVSWKATCDD
jgi:GTPase SAR1 family protein